MDGKSLNLTDEKLAQLKELFPEVFSENKVDFARLKEVLGETVVDSKEHYELSWAGKTEARREIQKQTTATLNPDKAVSINFGETENLFIEGENLEVLRILQKSYFGKVKMIYIDPPYNTGNDSFVYPDDYAERLEEYNKRAGVTDETGHLNKQDLWKKNTKENGQFHSVWLSMMYPRLYLARNLLREDGVIFVSIDDNEASNLKLLMDEIFGEENFVANIVWKKKYTGGKHTSTYVDLHEYILVYCKSRNTLEDLEITRPDEEKDKFLEEDEFLKERGRFYVRPLKSNLALRPTLIYPITAPDGSVLKTQWLVAQTTFEKLLKEKRVEFRQKRDGTYQIYRKYYENDGGGTVKPPSLIEKYPNTEAKEELKKLFSINEGRDNVFYTVKPKNLLKHLFEPFDEPDALVLDFFAGSGTTAHAVLELNEEDGGNRKFICVQMPEVLEENSEAYKAGYRSIADISKARITKVIEKLQATRQKELPLESKQALGFNAFTLAPSNFKNWRGDAEGDALLKQLDYFRQSQKDGSLTENMLYELLLKSGLALTTKIESVKVGKQTAYVVEAGKLFVFFEAFDKSIKEFIREKSPTHVVCLDSVFAGKDEDLSNFKLELSEAKIELTIL